MYVLGIMIILLYRTSVAKALGPIKYYIPPNGSGENFAVNLPRAGGKHNTAYRIIKTIHVKLSHLTRYAKSCAFLQLLKLSHLHSKHFLVIWMCSGRYVRIPVEIAN